MARQHVHNRRAGRGNGGSSWISYSDIMAALLLVFVLFLTFNLYQYNTMIEQKTLELNTQQLKLDEQEGLIIIQQGKLDEQQAELDKVRLDLDAKQSELDSQALILIGKQEELDDAQATLAVKESELADAQLALNNATALLTAQKEAFDLQTAKLDALVGIRTKIVKDLSTTLAEHNMAATVDEKTGDIMLESTVFFKTASYVIKDEGRAMLDEFLPLYLSVLLQPEYTGYLGEIIIEGHTDSDGDYINNLKLSQNRALSVAEYCLNMPTLSPSQRTLLQSILTAKGRSSSDLVYNEDGSENKEASRRVEFKFSLRDADMIDQMRTILTAGSVDELNALTEDDTNGDE